MSTASHATTACATSSAHAASRCPREQPTIRRTGRPCAVSAIARTNCWCSGSAATACRSMRVEQVPLARPRRRAGAGRRVVERQHRRRPARHRPGEARAGTRRRAHDRGAAPARQTRPGLLPRRRRTAARHARSAAAVFEDALAGVEAGRAGNFGFVVGVNRLDAAHAEALREHGADIVVVRPRRV